MTIVNNEIGNFLANVTRDTKEEMDRNGYTFFSSLDSSLPLTRSD